MARTVELRRHTDADGDVLTQDGVRAALEIGRRLEGTYDVVISSGAQRATQTVACLLAGMSRKVDGGVIVDTGFRSSVEERWFSAARRAAGKDLEAFRKVDPELVEQESALMGGVLQQLLESLRDGGRALVVGHSLTTEAAVLGLTGQVVAADRQRSGRQGRGAGWPLHHRAAGLSRIQDTGRAGRLRPARLIGGKRTMPGA
jgi:broad specificity phosphatase PhoE